MTSVIAWVAADSRRSTGLYFASDSRRTWTGKESNKYKDDCVKLFAVEGTCEIFAFAGDATFPPEILGTLCSRLKAEPNLLKDLTGAHERSVKVYSMIRDAFDALPTKPGHSFTILHGTREGAMYPATFHLFAYCYQLNDESMTSNVLDNVAEHSLALTILGSGGAIVKSFLTKETDISGDVSRAHFSAFCTSVASEQDEFSGGPIQLVGVLSIRDALHFGVITPVGKFYRGSSELPVEGTSIRWRNSHFDDVTQQGVLRRRPAALAAASDRDEIK